MLSIIPLGGSVRQSVAALVYLPTELLTSIFQHLDRDALLDLACVCSLLNDIALQIFFNDMNFSPSGPDSSSLSVGGSGQPFIILKAIRLSFTVKPLHQLDCVFSDINATEQMEEVRQLLILLPSVEGVSLQFSGRTSRLDWNWKQRDPTWILFTNAVLALLNALDGKSCTRLKVADLTPPLFNASNVVMLRMQEEPQALSTLHEVTLVTGRTLVGRIWGWLIQSLRKSPIHTLKLVSYRFPRVDFTPVFVLRHADLPHLTNILLRIEGSSTELCEKLALCLNRHPGVTSLHITLPHFWMPRRKPVVSFSSLVKLTATPSFVTDLLIHTEATPSLTTVHLLTASWKDITSEEQTRERPYQFNASEMTRAFAAISPRPTISHLSFTMQDPLLMARWMENISSPGNTDPEGRPASVLVLPQIFHLKVLQASHIMPVFVRWLKLFPNLRSLVLDDNPGSCSRTHFLEQLREAFSVFFGVAFSKDMPPKPVADWLGETVGQI